MIRVKRNEIEIVSKLLINEGKFYYFIRYKGDNNIWHGSFGSYNLENVKKWLNEYFIIED